MDEDSVLYTDQRHFEEAMEEPPACVIQLDNIRIDPTYVPDPETESGPKPMQLPTARMSSQNNASRMKGPVSQAFHVPVTDPKTFAAAMKSTKRDETRGLGANISGVPTGSLPVSTKGTPLTRQLTMVHQKTNYGAVSIASCMVSLKRLCNLKAVTLSRAQTESPPIIRVYPLRSPSSRTSNSRSTILGPCTETHLSLGARSPTTLICHIT